MLKQRGFTLIELIISIGIVALVAAAVFVSVDPAKRLGEAKDAVRQSDLIAISKAIETYIADYGALPDNILNSNINVGEKTVLCSTASSLTCGGETRDCLVVDDVNFINKLASLPVDPDKLDSGDTGYYITRGNGDNLVLGACGGYAATGIEMKSRVKLAASSASVEMTMTHTSDTDFSNGTLSSASISGSGDSASVVLSGSAYSSATINTAGTAWAMTISGDYLYLADYSGGLKIYNISTPSTPSSTGAIVTGSIRKVVIYGNYAYVADTSAVDIIDISDKYNPSSVGTISFFMSGVRQLYVDGSVLYVTYDTGACSGNCPATSMRSYSLASPTAPSLLDTVSVGYYNTDNDFEIVGDYAYMPVDIDVSCGCGVGDWSGLNWYDVSDPSNITLVSSTTLEGNAVKGMEISGNYVYVANGANGVKVISTSTNSVVESYALDSAYSLDLEGSSLYVSDISSPYSITRFDVSNPLSLSLKNNYSLSAYPYDMLKNGDYIYVTDGNLDVQALPVYSLSGTYTSEAIDTTSNLNFTTVDWTTTTPSNTDISIKIRTDSDSGMSGAAPWGGCDAINNGDDISASPCVVDGDRYVQYQVSFTTTDNYLTGLLDEINIKYNQ